VADYRGLVNAAKAGRSPPHHLQLIASIAVEGSKFRTCLAFRFGSIASYERAQITSGLCLKADISRAGRHVSKVPKPEKLNTSKCFPLCSQKQTSQRLQASGQRSLRVDMSTAGRRANTLRASVAQFGNSG
jgi:hypothetical protein